MTNPSKAKGDRYERLVCAYLREHGFPHAGRMLRSGAHEDRGDIAGIPGFLIDVKARRQLRTSEWLDLALLEALTLRETPAPVIVSPRFGRPVGDALVTMRLCDWAEVAR